jgi:leucyl/phenylalanyl-tRNA--protein transferase
MDAHALTDPLYWVRDRRLAADFPPTARALTEPDGLLAIGGDLAPERIVAAYRRGIFPWFSDGQPILWWAPDPRAVLAPDAVHVSRSLRRRLRRGGYVLTFDTDFGAVIDACAAPRARQAGTWITAGMRAAYLELHRRGIAHSFEYREDGQLLGGLYGLAIGRVFFGESMFSHVDDASKVAFVGLCRQLAAWDYALIDCQVETAHLAALGARPVPRPHFEAALGQLVAEAPAPAAWRAPERGS